MFLALVIYRIGWWSTIFCQQILLGMLTIFGPIQWAFSVLPKWEGAWAKWITRYLTVHFYGAMLYFVGFTFFFSLTLLSVYRWRTSLLSRQEKEKLQDISKCLHDMRLPAGGFHCVAEVPEFGAGPGSMDDS